MNSQLKKILFFHGLDSSRESIKFHVIDSKNKFCINVDYRNLSFQSVQDFYTNIIEKFMPDILVGHCVGGYWALKMSHAHHLPCVIANPNLSPSFRLDYPAITDEDLNHDIPQFAYLELGDEILNIHEIKEYLENYMPITIMNAGHHQLEQPENMNQLIQQIEQTYF
ncbi:esterase [Acinetobacter sp. ANC 4558]|uniref:YqiA/YcfP family alpha/beta fold hydrolase n=1 Tax=Acinetobacter sp. ANC 4558 TaxID=1977876 RepID=UPI000A32CB9D|nr:YqiA/YcfP family alpha/beta fold hydrolase [Acinetobacter sp. ANC 4558]OTG87574.1 esterase [Acinetobacter sp. ANC 4558]